MPQTCTFKVSTFLFQPVHQFWHSPSKLENSKGHYVIKAGKPEDLAGSYRPLSLTSYLGKLLEKAVAGNLSNWAEAHKKFNKQQNRFRKNRSTNDNLFKLFETIKLGFCKGHPTT